MRHLHETNDEVTNTGRSTKRKKNMTTMNSYFLICFNWRWSEKRTNVDDDEDKM